MLTTGFVRRRVTTGSISPEFDFIMRLDKAGVENALLVYQCALPELGGVSAKTTLSFGALPMHLTIYGFCGTHWYCAYDAPKDTLYLARGAYVEWE